MCTCMMSVLTKYLQFLRDLKESITSKYRFNLAIEYGTIGEGSQISTNQNRESTVLSLLIG